MNPISFFLKKQFEIEDKIQHLLKDIQDMVLRHQNAFEAYLEDDWDKFENSQKELIRLEKELDQVGHQIQMSLLREALMPDSRDDLLNLLTKLDEIPSKLKHKLADMGLENPSLPDELTPNFKNMLQYTRQSLDALTHAVDCLFSNLRSVRLYVEEVSRQESEVDRYEKELLKDVFENQNLDLARQYQLKTIIKELGSISNLAEDVGDAVLIIASKLGT